MTAPQIDNLITKEDTFGLDISNSRIKVMWVKERRDGSLRLKSFGSQKIPASAIVGGVVRRKKVVMEAIKTALANSSPKRIKTSYAVCAIPQEKILLKIEEFPNLNDDKLKQAIGYKLPEILGMPIDKIYWDWQRLSSSENVVQVLIASVTREVVDSYVEAIMQAGIIPLVLEMNVSSAARLLITEKGFNRKEPVIIVNVGNSNSTIAIEHQGGVRFASSVNIGGNQLIKIIGTKLKKSPNESLEYMRKVGLNTKSEELKTELRQNLDTLVQEIKNTISYYNKNTDGKSEIKSILLHGDGSILKGIDKYVRTEHFPGLKVAYISPHMRLIPIPQFIAHEKIYPHIIVSGLAVRGVKKYESTLGINLLPERIKQTYIGNAFKRRLNLILKVFLINVLALSMFLAGAWFIVDQKAKNVTNNIELKKSLLTSERITSISSEVESLNDSLASIDTLIDAELDWLKFFAQLSVATPNYIKITSIDVNIDTETKAKELQWNISINGITASKENIVSYSNLLAAQDVFENITFPVSNFSSTEELAADKLEFQIDAIMKFNKLLINPELFHPNTGPNILIPDNRDLN